MSFRQPADESRPSEPVPRLLVELPSRRQAFLDNFRDLILPRRSQPLELQSAPAAFWPDVFVRRRFPWSGFLQSAAYHGVAYVLLVAFTQLFSLQPRVVVASHFEHSQVVYYQASDFLPPIDTRRLSAPQPQKAAPEFSRQPIISVPPQADNRLQTIVTPPKIRLKHDVALPNVVAWSDEKKPRLAIPDVPLTPAAEITRMGPRIEETVVAPVPDAARLRQQRRTVDLQNSVVAPPPELQVANGKNTFNVLQPALIAPPPTVEIVSSRPVGDMNIAPSAVIAPAPQLTLTAQRSLAGRRQRSGLVGAVIVPPPPSVSNAASSGASFGSRGRMIALSLHPTVGAPPEPPAGNRRGAFAAKPEGHPGASGSPGSRLYSGKGNSGAATAPASDLPSGLYIGKAAEKTSPTAGISKSEPSSSVNPNLLADARRPRVSMAPAQPAERARLSEPEQAVFSGKKFYSLTLNMPNLNSAGGSWVVHFAEANHQPGAREGNTPADDISQPTAIRKVDPAYPLQLMRENVAGTVILYAVIHADGTVGNVRVLRGVDDRLDRFASQAVAQWKFDPATKNGVPVAVEATFQIPFRPSRLGTGF